MAKLNLARGPFRSADAPRAALVSLPRVGGHFGLGLVFLLALMVLAGGIGSVYIPPVDLVKIMLDRLPFVGVEQTWPDSWDTIVWKIRFPRVVLAALVGGGLALSGATYQGLFRNPLADPYLIGVASGAGLAATLVLLTSGFLSLAGFSILPLAAFVGGMLAVSIAYTIARKSGVVPLTTLLLAGVAIASLASAVTFLLMVRANPDVRPVLTWLLGSFVSSDWQNVKVVLPYILPGTALLLAYGRVLNLFQLGEREAHYLGMNVERTKLVLIALASLVTAAAVSVSGLIGFVGLIAPHAVRLVWGHDNRYVLPLSFVVGGGFLVLADLAARTILSPTELPVGVVTAFCGAPFFLYLLRRGRKLAL